MLSLVMQQSQHCPSVCRSYTQGGLAHGCHRSSVSATTLGVPSAASSAGSVYTMSRGLAATAGSPPSCSGPQEQSHRKVFITLVQPLRSGCGHVAKDREGRCTLSQPHGGRPQSADAA